MSATAVFDGRREVRTYVDLWHGANVLQGMAEASEEGSYYTIMASLLMRAFAFEAYLNHLGAKRISYWEDIDSIRVMDKFSVLGKDCRIAPDWSRRPYQALKTLFKFRNQIAHGQSVVLTASMEVPADTEPHQHMPRAAWEEFSTIEHALRTKEDVEAVIVELHKAAGLGDYPFVHGAGVGSLSLK